MFLTDHVFIELADEFPGRGNAIEQLFARSPPASFLFQNRLAELDAFAADVNVAGSFDQRSDVAITFAAERAKSVLLGRTAASSTRVDVPT